jgi:hypothetical protein
MPAAPPDRAHTTTPPPLPPQSPLPHPCPCRLLELDEGRGFVHRFGGVGSYEAWKEARRFRRDAQAAAAADARTLFRKEVEWMARQPKARSTKSTARVKAFYEVRGGGGGGSGARQPPARHCPRRPQHPSPHPPTPCPLRPTDLLLAPAPPPSLLDRS